MLALFKTTFIIGASYIIFRFFMTKLAKKTTYIEEEKYFSKHEGSKSNSDVLFLDEDFPALDLPKGVYVLPPNAKDPSIGKIQQSKAQVTI